MGFAVNHTLYVLLKSPRRVVLATLVAAAAAGLFGEVQGPRYTATARLLAAPANAAQDHGQAARNVAEILRDPALVRGMEPALKAGLPPPRWWEAKSGSEDQRLTARFARALRIEAVPDTDIVALRFTWSDPGFAAAALNLLLHNEQRIAAGDAASAQSVILATARLRDAQAQFARLDEQIGALPLVAGATPDAGAIEREKDRVASRIASAHSSADALRVERELAARKLEAAEKAYAGGGWVDNPDSPATSSGASTMDPTFVALLEKRARLVAKVPADFPGVHEVDVEIAQAREHAYQSVHQVLGERLHNIDDRLAALAAQSASDEAEQRGLDDHLVQLEALQGSRQTAAAQVAEAARALDEQKREADTAVHEAAGLRVMSEATPPPEPDFPSTLFLVGAASLAGFVLGLASAFLAEHNRITIDRPQDIARLLKIPVLASIPDLR